MEGDAGASRLNPTDVAPARPKEAAAPVRLTPLAPVGSMLLIYSAFRLNLNLSAARASSVPPSATLAKRLY
jgi:hypothetical protein